MIEKEKTEDINLKLYWFWLACFNEFTYQEISSILQEFKTPKELFYAAKQDIIKFFEYQLRHRKKKEEEILKQKENLISSRVISLAVQKYNKAISNGIQFITSDESIYPKQLKEIYEPPYWLFVRGKLPDRRRPSIAIIGARKCSLYGKEIARWFASLLSEKGVQIISGMAEGIDGIAHAAALDAKADTFAVLGSGIDVCYPKEHSKLYERIREQGGILSEYPPGAIGLPFHFPMRNRIISGLCDGILVVEARERSGTLITVDRGLEQGKDIFAVPGRIGDCLSYGCNHLIQMGAKLVNCVDDIFEEIYVKYPLSNKDEILSNHKSLKNGQITMTSTKNTANKLTKTQEEKNFIYNLLETEEKIVYANLSLVPKHIELLCTETKLSIKQLYSILLAMELKGIIKQTMKNYYMISQ